MTEPATILLVDLSSVFWIAYHVSGADDADAARRRTVARVRGYAQTYEHIALCIDAPRTWRHELSATYKANREAKPEDARASLRNALATLEREGFPMWRADGYEADDIIASATVAARARGLDVMIATADKDLAQLVGDGVRILDTRDGGGIIGPDEVCAKFGVGPELLGDWLAIVGDKADNIAGIPGIGPKGATKLLERFGRLADILDAPNLPERALDWELHASNASEGELVELGPKPVVPDPPLTPKLAEALRTHAEQAFRSRELVRLRTDVPIDIDEALRSRVSQTATNPDDFEESENDQMSDEKKTDEAAPESGPQAVTEAPAPAVVEAPEVKVEPQPKPAQLASPQDVADFEARGSASIVKAPSWEHSLEPSSLRDAMKVSRVLFESRMFGHLNNPEGVFTAVLLARSHGVETMKMLMPGVLHNIKGKLTLSAQLIVGLVLRSGKAEYFDLVESTTARAVYVTKRRGSSREVTFEYTIEEAQAAGLLEPTRSGEPSQYLRRPKTMLRHRCETELARAVYPDVVGGLYTPDEMSEAA